MHFYGPSLWIKKVQRDVDGLGMDYCLDMNVTILALNWTPKNKTYAQKIENLYKVYNSFKSFEILTNNWSQKVEHLKGLGFDLNRAWLVPGIPITGSGEPTASKLMFQSENRFLMGQQI